MSTIAPHQQAFKDTARDYEGCWFGTGCTKTRTCLYAVQEYEGSILVLAPKTTVQKKQWQYEAEVLKMKTPVVMSKETFRRDHQSLPKYDVLILEEAHYFLGVTPYTRQRNKVKIPKASQLYEAVQWYIKKYKPKRVILATATPNKTPMSVWAAAQILGYKWDFYKFRETFYFVLPMDRGYGQQIYAQKRDEASMERLAKATQKIGKVLSLKDIRDVPDQVFMDKEFELTAAQKKALKDLPSLFSGDTSLRSKQHQIENGILYRDIFNEKTGKVERTVTYFPNEKLDYIIERAIEFKKMVIFASYTAQVDMIAKALEKEGKKVFILDSRTKDRKVIETQMEALESAYIVAQASVSSEWEAKSCPVMIFASLTNRNLDYIQGKGRIQRYDKVKKNIYIHLKTMGDNSIDEKWFNTIMSGKDFNEAIYEKE